MSSPAPAKPAPHPKPWEEKDPWISGVLAYLIPGAGHFYQGRTAKGVIYTVSILGLFFWGQKMGEGMVVYNRPDGAMRYVSLSYAAQLGAGVSALPALLQNYRANSESNRIVTPSKLTGPYSSEFQGQLNPSEDPNAGQLVGTIRFEPAEGQFGPEVRGTFEGTLDGKPTTLTLGGRMELDRPIKAGHRRKLECGVVDADSVANPLPRWIVGTVPRPIWNSYGTAPDPGQLQDVSGQLGKVYELALVFTWIAGLLNVLAIWDCVLGPAYGFGDEPAPAKSAESSAVAPSSSPSETPLAAQQTNTEESPRTETRPPHKSPV